MLSALTSKGHARFAQRSADGGDIVSVESRIEGLHGRPAQVPAGQAGHREGGYAYDGQGGQTLDAQSLQVRPKPFDLRQQVRRRVWGPRDEFAPAIVGSGACAGIARINSARGRAIEPSEYSPRLTGH